MDGARDDAIASPPDSGRFSLRVPAGGTTWLRFGPPQEGPTYRPPGWLPPPDPARWVERRDVAPGTTDLELVWR